MVRLSPIHCHPPRPEQRDVNKVDCEKSAEAKSRCFSSLNSKSMGISGSLYYIGLIYARYLQFRFLEWPLSKGMFTFRLMFNINGLWKITMKITQEMVRIHVFNGGFPYHSGIIIDDESNITMEHHHV